MNLSVRLATAFVAALVAFLFWLLFPKLGIWIGSFAGMVIFWILQRVPARDLTNL